MIDKKYPALIFGMSECGLGVGRSLGRKGIKVIGIDSKKNIGFFSKFITGITCPHPLDEQENFIEFLLNFRKTQIEKSILFITSDNFLLSISTNLNLLLDHYLLNFLDEKIIESIIDKYSQYKLARRIGIPVPQTYSPKNMDELYEIKNNLSFPLFIKAREVTSWRKKIIGRTKGFIIMSEKDLIDKYQMIFKNGLSSIVQEVIQGPDTNHYKFCCYYSKKGKLLLAFTLQKIRQNPIRFGIGSAVQSIHYPELTAIGKKLFEGLKYKGIGSAEFKLDQKDGKLKLIEINPRYWQQNILSEKCGLNFPFIDYLEASDQNPKISSDYKEGIKWINIIMDFFSFKDYKKLGELNFMEWVSSLKGAKVISDFSWDDLLPALFEIRFGKRFFYIPKFLIKKLKDVI